MKGLRAFTQQYRWGFSAAGCVCCMLVILPNVLWMVWPPANDPIGHNDAPWVWMDVVMRIAQCALVALLVFCVSRGYLRRWREPAVIMLVSYYAMWGLYYAGVTHPFVFVGLAAFPSVGFMCAAMWLRNRPALWCAVVFGALHISITAWNYI